MPKKKSKRFKQSKRFKHEPRKIKHIKHIKPGSVRLREKREAAVAQEAKARYQYHQLRLAYQGKSV